MRLSVSPPLYAPRIVRFRFARQERTRYDADCRSRVTEPACVSRESSSRGNLPLAYVLLAVHDDDLFLCLFVCRSVRSSTANSTSGELESCPSRESR